MEQLSFISPTLPTDLIMLKDTLNEMISKICDEQEVDPKFLSIEERKPKEDNTTEIIGYSIWILEPISLKKTDRVFSIIPKNTQKTKRFEIELKYDKREWFPIPNEFEEKISDIKKKEGNNIYITKKYSLFVPLDSSEIYSFLYKLIEKALRDFAPSDKFGCCAKYEECSNAKRCLHNNNFYARCCYYRQNLEAGRIFYGVNKNI